jgi:uncharacterized membrane protein
MASLTVWKFDSAGGAQDGLATLEQLRREDVVQIDDAAFVTWPIGAKKPETHQMSGLTGSGALGGAFWGLLFGLIFFVPFLGAAIGAAMGGFAGSLTDVGIDDKFVKEVRDQVKPGTSALFLLTENAVVDRVSDATQDWRGHVTLIHTNLSDEQEDQLREAFSAEAAPV